MWLLLSSNAIWPSELNQNRAIYSTWGLEVEANGDNFSWQLSRSSKKERERRMRNPSEEGERKCFMYSKASDDKWR